MSQIENPPTNTEVDNEQIKKIRSEYDSLKVDFAKQKEQLEALMKEKTEMERQKLDENERLKLELEDSRKSIQELTNKTGKIETLETQLSEINEHFKNEFETILKTVEKDKIDKVRSLTWDESSPRMSVSKLRDLLDITATASANNTVTNPPIGGDKPGPGTNPSQKIDLTQVSSNVGLRPLKDVQAEIQEMRDKQRQR